MTYQEAKNTILNALTNRPVGSEVQVQNHQNAEMAILDYARSIQQSIGSSLFVDFTYFTEEPYIPQTGYALYIGYIAPSEGTTTTLNYFFDLEGDEYQVTTSENEFVLAFLLWNGTYWDLMQCNVPIASGGGGGGEVILYGSTGQNTDGAMTQKATTDALALKQNIMSAGDYITIGQGTQINAAEQAYNAVSPGSTPPQAGELIPQNSLVMLGLSDSKLYNIVGNSTRALDPNWGLALLTQQTSANSSPAAARLVQQGLLSAPAGILYSTFVNGASYFIGFTEDTTQSGENQAAIKPTGKIYTSSQLYTAKILTYMYIGRGTVISNNNYIQLDLSAHTIFTYTGTAITHINGVGTGITPLTKQTILLALGYEELTDIVLTTTSGKGFSANIIGQRI
jgi:hypothetical protein